VERSLRISNLKESTKVELKADRATNPRISEKKNLINKTPIKV
jgi:hypothetical protein